MYALMSPELALFTECLITNIKDIRALTSMDVLMSCQTALLTECLTTHMTYIRALTTMHA